MSATPRSAARPRAGSVSSSAPGLPGSGRVARRGEQPAAGPAARALPAVDPGDGPVILGPESRFDGLLTFRGRARVEGELRGDVVCQGVLRVGAGARIAGTIDADELILHGRLHGNATVRGRIELGPTASVTGTLRAPRIALAEGCVLEGRCEMPTAPKAPTGPARESGSDDGSGPGEAPGG